MLNRALMTMPMLGLIVIGNSIAHAEESKTSPERGLIVQPIKASRKCSERNKILKQMRSKIKRNSEDTKKETYIERKNGKSYDFVVLDKSKASLEACLNEKSFSAKLSGEVGDEVVIDSDLVDFNSDGTPEFLLWNRSCDEGPCFGKRVLIGLANDKFTIGDSLDATLIEVVKQKDEWVFARTNYCFTYEMEIIFEYKTFAELDKSGKFKSITLAETKKRFPELVKKALASIETSNSSSASENPKRKQQLDAFKKIEGLIKRAYQGEPDAVLQREFKKIEVALGDNTLSTHCEIPQVLRDIQGLPLLENGGGAGN